MGGRGEGGEAAAMKCEVPNAANQGTNERESLFLIVALHLGLFSNVYGGGQKKGAPIATIPFNDDT